MRKLGADDRTLTHPYFCKVVHESRSPHFRYIKLVKNFRSHNAILYYPNDRFYNSELEVCGSPLTINSFLGSSQLPERKFPVIFHAISGENERESTSPSYFNIDEATEVADYIQELLRDRSHPVRKYCVIRPPGIAGWSNRCM